MADNPYAGLLGQFGIIGEKEEQLRRRRDRARLDEAFAGAAPVRGSNAEANALAIGQRMGAALGVKMNPSQVTSDEQAQIEAVTRSRERFETMKASDPTIAADAHAAKTKYMRVLAEELMRSGDIERGVEMLSAADQRQLLVDKQAKELERLGIQVEREGVGLDKDQLNLEIMGEDRIRKLAGETGAFVPLAAGIDDINNSVVTGRVNENGELVAINPVTGEEYRTTQFLTLEDALKLREAAAKANGKGGSEGMKLFLSALPATDRRQISARRSAVTNQSKIMDGIAKEFQKFIDAGRAPEEILATPGRISTFVNNMKGIITATGSAFTAAAGIGNGDEDNPVVRLDGKERVGKQIMDSGQYDDLLGSIIVPQTVSEAGISAEVYKAQVVELAYAIARANEPGARQLSDQDFRKALEQIGATSGDPRSFGRVVLQNFIRRAEAVEADADRVAGVGRVFGIPREQALGVVYGTDFKKFRNSVTSTRDTFQRLGTSLAGDNPDAVSVGDQTFEMLP